MTPLLRRVIVSSSGGPFLEGYVLPTIGVASGAMDSDLILSAHRDSLLGVPALTGLFPGASFGGWLTDLIDRHKMFVIDLVVIAILSILCTLVRTPLTFMILRFFVGVAMGAGYPITTSTIVEFSPCKYRAAAMDIIAAAWYLGANIAALMDFALINMNHGWCYILASSAVPCTLTLVGRWNIPRPPRWLVSKGWSEEVQRIVHETLETDVRLPEAEETAKISVSKVLQDVYLQHTIFVGITWLCQATPMFVLYTYGPQVAAAVGLGEGRGVLLGELPIGTFFILGTFPTMYLYRKIDRRPLITVYFGGITVALAIIGFFPGAGIGPIIDCFIPCALLSGGPGNLEWLYPNEPFLTEIRATATGLTMASSRISTVVSIYVSSGFIGSYDIGEIMLTNAPISAPSFGVSVIWALETCGYTLVETGSVDFEGR